MCHAPQDCWTPYLGLAERINFFSFKKPRSLCPDLHFLGALQPGSLSAATLKEGGCEEGGRRLRGQVDAAKAWGGTAAPGSRKSSCPTPAFQVPEEERSSP